MNESKKLKVDKKVIVKKVEPPKCAYCKDSFFNPVYIFHGKSYHKVCYSYVTKNYFEVKKNGLIGDSKDVMSAM